MIPPADIWYLLPNDYQLPPGANSADYIWRLLRAVYGLKDAPRLWVLSLVQVLLAAGWVTTSFDDEGLRSEQICVSL